MTEFLSSINNSLSSKSVELVSTSHKELQGKDYQIEYHSKAVHMSDPYRGIADFISSVLAGKSGKVFYIPAPKHDEDILQLEDYPLALVSALQIPEHSAELLLRAQIVQFTNS